MPNLILPLESADKAIYNDIYFDVIEDVAKFIKANPATINVLHNSVAINKTDIKNTAFINSQDDNNTPLTISQRSLTVNVKDDYDDESVGVDLVNKRDYHAIFKDSEIVSSITPIYVTNNIEFSFSYRCSSKLEITQMRDLLRMHLTRSFELMTHKVHYTMLLPPFVNMFLTDIHGLKNRLYPIEFEEYIQTHSSNSLHIVTDMVGDKNASLAVRESQDGIQGLLGMVASPPNRDSEEEENIHSLNFTYNIQMDIPKYLNISFPIMVCNRPMPDDYLEVLERYMIKTRKEEKYGPIKLSRSMEIMSHMFSATANSNRLDNPIYPINIPIFDDYRDYTERRGFAPIMTILCQLNEDNHTDLFNLNDLEDFYFPDYIKKYVDDGKANRLTRLGGSFVLFTLEQLGFHFANDNLQIDKDYNVSAIKKIDPIRPVRVCVRVCTDVTMLNEAAKEDLVNDHDLFEAFLCEYLEVKDMMRTTKPEHIQSSENLLFSIVIRKLRRLLDLKEFDRAKVIVNIFGTCRRTSAGLGRFLTHGYPELKADLERHIEVYIAPDDYLRFLSSNPKVSVFEKMGKMRKEHYDLEHRPRTPMSEVLVRESLSLYIPRTHMYKSVVAMRKE